MFPQEKVYPFENKFADAQDDELCVTLAKVMIQNVNGLAYVMTQFRFDSMVWRGKLAFTDMGQLCMEVVDRGITREIFENYVRIYWTSVVN